MVVATGMSYDRHYIEAWWEDHSTDPSSGVDIGHVPRAQRLAPNLALRKLIATWRTESCGPGRGRDSLGLNSY